MKIGAGIQKVMGGGTHTDMQTHRQKGDLRSLILFFQNEESRLKYVILGLKPYFHSSTIEAVFCVVRARGIMKRTEKVV
jgi:hypothetical protein